jgi:hypothetical protein
MKHMRRLIGFIIALLIPLGISAPVFAETQSVSVQITVTAVVPSHRDIILDKNGNITEIDSNTKEDVTPDAYIGSAKPENKVPLTDDLFGQYRQHVPEGTAKYGVLYKRPIIQTLTSAPKKPVLPQLFVANTLYRNS